MLGGKRDLADVAARHHPAAHRGAIDVVRFGNRIEHQPFAQPDPQIARHDLYDVRNDAWILTSAQDALEDRFAAAARRLSRRFGDFTEERVERSGRQPIGKERRGARRPYERAERLPEVAGVAVTA